jgi:hypothetical protein
MRTVGVTCFFLLWTVLLIAIPAESINEGRRVLRDCDFGLGGTSGDVRIAWVGSQVLELRSQCHESCAGYVLLLLPLVADGNQSTRGEDTGTPANFVRSA